MAPSDGLKCQRLMKIIFLVVSIIHASQSIQFAKDKYEMDKSGDCASIGNIDLERGKTISILARSMTTNVSPIRSCTLRFAPHTKGDTLTMWFDSGAYIQDCSLVSLIVQMNEFYQMPCPLWKDPPTMSQRNGVLKIQVQRSSLTNTKYDFKIWVKAERSVDESGGDDGGGLGVGEIVGIIAGVIVFVTIICVVCICCFMKQKKSDKIYGDSAQPVQTHDNTMMKNGTLTNSVDESPASDRRLLGRNENDSSLRGQQALDRFGPVVARKQKNSRDEYSDVDVDVESGRREKGRERPRQQEENNTRRSPLLSDLHHNPKFRRSFHDNDNDANDRLNRISNTSEENSSVNSRGVNLPPKLPPVPKSPPRSPRSQHKIATISRDRPLSSSSDLARQLDQDSPDEVSEDDVKRGKKADTRHTMKPNRGQRKSRRDEEDDSEEERRRRRKEKERKERECREEEEEEDRRRKKKEERRRRKEQEDERERKRDRDIEDDSREKEGRFKKSASGRKSKGKGPRMGRTRSTGNALEEMEKNYQRSRSKSPSSVHSLNFIEGDDDDDLDSSYMPFKRSGSKQSLYASRSSLYGRRRKSSTMGETISLSSYAYDDADSRFGDFDKKGLSRREKNRMFKSTGELEMHTATAQVVRECATQTGAEKTVYIYERKTIAKSRPGRMYSRGSQTGVGRERRDSTGSARSGKSGRSSKSNSRLKHRSKSQESLSKKKSRSRSRNLDNSDDSDDRRSRKSRSRSRNLDLSDDDDEEDSRRARRKHHRSKSRGLEDDDDDDDRHSSKGGRSKPRPRPRKSTAASIDLSDSDVASEGGRSAAPSSIAASMAHPPPRQNPYGPQYVPVMGQPVTFLPTAPGGPPMVPVLPTAAGFRPPLAPKPAVAPKPQKSKWDTLVEITEGEKQRRRWEGDTETESVMSSSVYGNSAANGAHVGAVYAPPSYTTAQRYPHPNVTLSPNYPNSSGQPYSARGPRDYKLDSSYAPSESMI